MATAAEARKGPDDEGTINVASKKSAKAKPKGPIKLRKPAPKHMKPGNWREGSVADSGFPRHFVTHSHSRTILTIEK
ncbi:hypothetical protein NPX13_g7920 [Xylaria arbuscula]|uniref:Uncharacterized protein n=1 Tax=Xylaria arbuscula TaxID=114810 RepID=A0A9W8N9D8_9PEZI|nr:hypothetical protein NPX13_g7920 [Xylaria arbuscula]